MPNGLLRLAAIHEPRSWIRSQSGRLLSGFGLSAAFPRVADAARKDERRAGNEDHKDNEGKENRGNGGDSNNSGKDKNAEAKSEEKKSDERENKGNETQNSDKGDPESGRDQRDDGGREKTRAESDRQEAKRQDAATDSDESSRNDDRGGSDQDNGRRAHDLEQRADEVPVADDPVPTVAAPTNPNVVITDTPETISADLVVEANPDVIASVSSSGGFAFARSNNVTAFTGPDGATIIQSGPVVPTSTADPVEPSDDGGNNDLDFTS